MLSPFFLSFHPRSFSFLSRISSKSLSIHSLSPRISISPSGRWLAQGFWHFYFELGGRMKNTLAQEAARACISLLRSIMHDGAVAIHTPPATRQTVCVSGASQEKLIDARAGAHLQQLIPHLFALWYLRWHFNSKSQNRKWVRDMRRNLLGDCVWKLFGLWKLNGLERSRQNKFIMRVCAWSEWNSFHL